MPIIKPENPDGPFTIHIVGQIEEEQIDGLMSRYEDGPPEGKKDRPRTFNTIKQAEKWLNMNISPEQIEQLEWRIITTSHAVTIRDDLVLNGDTKKFLD